MYTFLIFFILIKVCYSNSVYGELLYKTKNQEFTDENSQSNCVYFSFVSVSRVHTVVPYCLRSSDVSFPESSSIHGELFESLYQRNITSDALLIDHAPLDVIEDYEIYFQKTSVKCN
jgi:hypothetical protein